MSDEDGLELYRMLKTACDVLDVLLTMPSIDTALASLTDAGRIALVEYASMRRFMGALAVEEVQSQ